MKSCPQCENSKFFYDQYHQAAFPEAYAMCKFCGYWKKEGEEPKQCNIFYHECEKPNHPRLGYCWGFGDEVNCEWCGKNVNNKVKWPVDDPNHPFHNYK